MDYFSYVGALLEKFFLEKMKEFHEDQFTAIVTAFGFLRVSSKSSIITALKLDEVCSSRSFVSC